MALRFIRFAAGGPLARSETGRMITEKVQALGEAQTAAAIAAISGRNSRHVAKKVLGVYKKRVRGNRRRLAKYMVNFKVPDCALCAEVAARPAMSVSPPKADIERLSGNVRLCQ